MLTDNFADNSVENEVNTEYRNREDLNKTAIRDELERVDISLDILQQSEKYFSPRDSEDHKREEHSSSGVAEREFLPALDDSKQ